MSDFKIYPRDKLEPFTLPTGQPHRIVVHRYKVAMVEVEDLHFHHDSAVMMPDRDPADAADAKSGTDLSALSILRACYLYAKDHAGKKAVCLGHTDRSGDDPYNLELSKQRAHNVWAIMMGKQDEWTKLCMAQHVVRDYQLLLKWIANVRYWQDCDPGTIDGTHGNKTSQALRAFKKHYNQAYGGSLKDNGVVDKPTWDAFFKMYMVGLAGIMQTDEAGLDPYRQAIDWLDPAWDGCGECHPITKDTAANYRSPVDRRVEVLFFESAEVPRFGDCHPSAKSRVPEQCELYRKDFLGRRIYVVEPIPVEPSAVVSLKLAEVRGLYQPGYSDPADVAAKTALASGYEKGYRGQGNDGRIFVNQIPRVDTSVSWEDIKQKNQQYIELSATIDVAKGTLPPDAQVVWEWTDPIEMPDESVFRDDVVPLLRPVDPATGKPKMRFGFCDFPKEEAGKEPVFESITPYTMEKDTTAPNRCFTLISGGKSEVRLHCTDGGGDLVRVQATVRPWPGLKVTAGDETGTMAMWKRVDVEHRRMPSAEPIPAEEIAPYFLRQYVQMDIAPEQQTTDDTRCMDQYKGGGSSDPYLDFVEDEFKNKYKPGWFFICVAQEFAAPAGKPRQCLYEGPGKLVIPKPVPLKPPGKHEYFWDGLLPQWESVVIDGVLKDPPLRINIYEDGKIGRFRAGHMDADTPKGKTTIRIESVDFQSDFEAADGSLWKAHEKTALYFPRYRYRWPERVWEAKGYGFKENIYVSLQSRGSAPTDGVSPPAYDSEGVEHFAGRTIIFCRHPVHTRPASADLTVAGTWSAGDTIKVTIDGLSASYQVAASDLDVPKNVAAAGITDPDFYRRGQVAKGIQDAINGDPLVSAKASAISVFGQVTLSWNEAGKVGDGKPVAVSVTSSGGTGTVTLSGAALSNGGFDDKSKEGILQTFTHELGHAFGFPHKCGYRSFEKSPLHACTMNYYNNWLYKLGTHLDPAKRSFVRFETGTLGRDFCAHHTRGIRLVRLEKNLAIWKW
jgi:hypothetical protein